MTTRSLLTAADGIGVGGARVEKASEKTASAALIALNARRMLEMGDNGCELLRAEVIDVAAIVTGSSRFTYGLWVVAGLGKYSIGRGD